MQVRERDRQEHKNIKICMEKRSADLKRSAIPLSKDAYIFIGWTKKKVYVCMCVCVCVCVTGLQDV